MEKEFQVIAEEVRGDIRSAKATNPRAYPLVRDVGTFDGGCQNTACLVREKLKPHGIEATILRLGLGYNGTVYSTHIVAAVGEIYIDPAITQYVKGCDTFVFSRTEYPLRVLEETDITNSPFLNNK